MLALRSRDRVPAMFRALGDPTRVRILHLLRAGELCVCDLMGILGVPQAKTSRHLRYLLRTGLLTVREAGPWSYYSLAPATTEFHRRLLECLDASPVDAADARRAARIRKEGGCCPA
jgi:ArsR family transcriptional regulator